MIWRSLKYLHHQFHLKHIRGHGIHSPYLFSFVDEALYNSKNIRVPEEILMVHRAMRKDCSLITSGEDDPFGAGSKTGRGQTRSIRSFVKGASVSMKFGSLLFRTARWFKPDAILELGTGLGISTMYLAGGSPGTPVHTVEGSRLRTRISEHTIKRCGLTNVKVHCGEVDEVLKELLEQLPGKFLAFLDADHREGPTRSNVRDLIEKAGQEALIILDDIYWSKGMYSAWKEVSGWHESRGTADLFHMGFLLLRKDIEKISLKIKF